MKRKEAVKQMNSDEYKLNTRTGVVKHGGRAVGRE